MSYAVVDRKLSIIDVKDPRAIICVDGEPLRRGEHLESAEDLRAVLVAPGTYNHSGTLTRLPPGGSNFTVASPEAVSATTADEDVVTLLRDMLARAQAGELRSVAVIAVGADGVVEHSFEADGERVHMLVSGTTLLQTSLVHTIMVG